MEELLGQRGPTTAVDALHMTRDPDGKWHVLIAHRPNGTGITLLGGGMIDPNESPMQAGKREAYEEGIKHVPEEY